MAVKKPKSMLSGFFQCTIATPRRHVTTGTFVEPEYAA